MHVCSKVKYMYSIIFNSLQFACWVILHAFSSSAGFFEINFIKKLFQEHHQIVKWFGSVGPDLGPNCLQWLSADNKMAPLAGKELRMSDNRVLNGFIQYLILPVPSFLQ